MQSHSKVDFGRGLVVFESRIFADYFSESRITRMTPNQEINGMNAIKAFPGYECYLGIPRITRISADFSLAVCLSIAVGFSFSSRFTETQTV